MQFHNKPRQRCYIKDEETQELRVGQLHLERIWALPPSGKMAAAVSAFTSQSPLFRGEETLFWNPHSHWPDCVMCSFVMDRETEMCRLEQANQSHWVIY